MSTGEDENVPPQENGQFEPFFITEDVEAELIAAGYEFEPPNHVRTASTTCLSQTTGSSKQ
ncbi:hypothetical protein [Pseudomonas sp. NCCP-436]|uniref:hypothetical protein n=1 Tax=Pseudomonas sp. NCCP-436 TaxID=2842481 RepID=UPI001C7FB80C|nr:hypothetical protein [Pseudomonas sp. NCCP-436]GIZ12689.1 hypothetical protein NCCP436_21050 [Pseudomonas sp. NCCP-436]